MDVEPELPNFRLLLSKPEPVSAKEKMSKQSLDNTGSFNRFEPTDKEPGRYSDIERLTAGGMGVVYRAYDTILAKPVAIKTLIFDHLQEILVPRFQREAMVVSKLNHPNIVRPKLIDFDSLYFRLETQLSTPLDNESSLFLVKVDVIPLKKVWNEKILESINSMSENVLKYKNLIEIKKFLNS